MEILLGTNHLQDFTGSEIIILEFAEYFSSLGHNITLFANCAGSPLDKIIENTLGLTIETDPENINPFSYDIVYFQHQVAGLFNYSFDDGAKRETAFIFGRLSRRSYMESGGWLHDQLIADHTFANSLLTAEHLEHVGVKSAITTFHNAAPPAYFRDRVSYAPKPLVMTVISNHADPVLLEAINLLKSQHIVRHLGRSGTGQQLVTPEIIQESDLVVSIGKSVQYALTSRTPVYVYDHFGGPGYLDESNFDRAARYNFTGRCCGRKLSPTDLAEDIAGNYKKGVDFAQSVSSATLARYHLPTYLDKMLSIPPTSNADRLKAMSENRFLAQERMLAEHIRVLYRDRAALKSVITDAMKR
ncbi:hypothetical protein [Azospirillum sp. B506]|uniref:hypothetical protein n=1 Tax=Azospirillum sp. B506 TaxID=137721 RepID=UPI00034C1209|nr:hypothetical protein [Azospirillum sp. B506]